MKSLNNITTNNYSIRLENHIFSKQNIHARYKRQTRILLNKFEVRVKYIEAGNESEC